MNESNLRPSSHSLDPFSYDLSRHRQKSDVVDELKNK